MSLSAGTRLGAYEILGPLGAGGMGEVYRARDTRLGREIALKVLPAAVGSDPERLARFESEARVVASLSHPGVLALHDFGTESGITFAVTELVDGQSLRERLLAGPIAAPRAIPIGIQIAHALAAAHDRGVVHRDLKPENVMLTPEGRIKLLDFGLARRDPPPAPGSQSLAPTVAALTEPGTVLGTTGYMAPEQVRGQSVDARADLFALGVLLYEMLAGRPPFRGDSAADTMTAILREDPAPLALAAPDTPPALQRIVERCLEKLPAARFRSAADLAFALEAVSSGSSAGAPAAAVTGASRPVRFRRLTFRNGHVAVARFTPDGASVVYGAAWDGGPHEIYTSRIGSAESRGLGLPAGSILSMSAGGEMAVSLGYRHFSWFQVSGTLARVALAGGGVRPLQKDVGHADWSPDGRTMAVIRYRDRHCLLEYPPGRVLVETDDWLHRCRVSPNGAHVAFGRHHRTGGSEADVCVVSSDGGVRTLAADLTNLSGIAWSPDGSEVWYSGIDARQRHGLWASPTDGRSRDLHASATRISLHDVRADGCALVTMDELRASISMGDSAEAPETDSAWFDGSVIRALSPDGLQMLFAEVAEAENPHYATYVRTLDGSPAVRLGEGIGLGLSADGAWVLAATHHARRSLSLYPTGFGEPRELEFPELERALWAGFHPDGAHLFVVGGATGGSLALWLAPLAGGPMRSLWSEPMDFDRFEGLPISPDGERLVVRRAGGEHLQLAWRTGESERLRGLSPDDPLLGYDDTGRFLFVSSGRPPDRVIARLEIASGERTPWRRLRLHDARGAVYQAEPVVAANGSRYGYSVLRIISNLVLVEGLSA